MVDVANFYERPYRRDKGKQYLANDYLVKLKLHQPQGEFDFSKKLKVYSAMHTIHSMIGVMKIAFSLTFQGWAIRNHQIYRLPTRSFSTG